MLAMMKTALHYLMIIITGNTMVIVLTDSVNSAIHFVKVDVLGRCESFISVLYVQLYFTLVCLSRDHLTVPCVQAPVCM